MHGTYNYLAEEFVTLSIVYKPITTAILYYQNYTVYSGGGSYQNQVGLTYWIKTISMVKNLNAMEHY